MARMCSRRHFLLSVHGIEYGIKDEMLRIMHPLQGSRVPASQRPVAINAGPLQPADREFAVLRAQQARRAAPAFWRTSRHGP
jgi:hypothetical protein